MSRRSESRERSSLIITDRNDEKKRQELEEFEKNAEAAISDYNAAHTSDDLDLVSCTVKDGVLVLRCKYSKVSSIEDLNARLVSEFISGSKREFIFDYRVLDECIEAYTPLRNVSFKKNLTSKFKTCAWYTLSVIYWLCAVFVFYQLWLFLYSRETKACPSDLYAKQATSTDIV